MPATRPNIWDLVNGPSRRGPIKKVTSPAVIQPSLTLKASVPVMATNSDSTEHERSGGVTYFPRGNAERSNYRTKDGRKVTPHQWAVYDYILNIPKGSVATYKSVCDGLGQGSPRSVGSALRNNPFAPYVPCHRVISSDLYLGGYCGEWGPQSKTGTQFHRKLQLLKDEGVDFDDKGMLRSREKLV